MDDVGEPHAQIDLMIAHVTCPLHSEPFREDWPLGWLPFSVELLRIVTGESLFMDECASEPGWINGALDRLPLCERVSDVDLLEAYQECGIGKVSVCENCDSSRRGVTMRLMQPGNEVPSRLDHVCFECVVYRLRHPST